MQAHQRSSNDSDLAQDDWFLAMHPAGRLQASSWCHCTLQGEGRRRQNLEAEPAHFSPQSSPGHARGDLETSCVVFPLSIHRYLFTARMHYIVCRRAGGATFVERRRLHARPTARPNSRDGLRQSTLAWQQGFLTGSWSRGHLTRREDAAQIVAGFQTLDIVTGSA